MTARATCGLGRAKRGFDRAPLAHGWLGVGEWGRVGPRVCASVTESPRSTRSNSPGLIFNATWARRRSWFLAPRGDFYLLFSVLCTLLSALELSTNDCGSKSSATAKSAWSCSPPEARLS